VEIFKEAQVFLRKSRWQCQRGSQGFIPFRFGGGIVAFFAEFLDTVPVRSEGIKLVLTVIVRFAFRAIALDAKFSILCCQEFGDDDYSFAIETTQS